MMTSILFQDFNERSKEVSKYFLFLQSLEQGITKLVIESKEGNKTQKVDPELAKTLKASAFLLLYNLIESTMRNAIEAIFDELQSQGVSFDEIRPELKKVVLKNLNAKLNKTNIDEFYKNIVDVCLALEIIKVSKPEKLFSGNIDALEIKKKAKEYGFSAKTKTDSSDLLTVKTNRNDLAHGIKSFAEVGKDKSAEELIKIQDNVVKYLKQILDNIETYLANKEYLDSSTGTP